MTCILPSRQKSKQRSCLCCNALFIPDSRNQHHQQYCDKSECRKASKRAAQARWLNSSKGEGYFSGTDNADRVRAWRKAHPGYWKRKKAPRTEDVVALQDFTKVQVIEKTPDPEITQNHALQEFCFLQPALIIGLIANLTGCTLQEDIAATSRRMVDFGRDILGKAMPIPKTS